MFWWFNKIRIFFCYLIGNNIYDFFVFLCCIVLKGRNLFKLGVFLII